ncbi:MAG: 2-dehydropantoate 2-reductase [Dehalococcoidia bacterium]
MTKRVIFIGAGAVGSYLGGWLTHTGHDVTLVDPWAENVEAIRRDGLSVSGPHDTFTANPEAIHLHESQVLTRRDPFDIAFIAVKSFDTAWATQLAKRFVAPDGYFVSSQNCWNDNEVAAIVGHERSVGLIMSSIQVALWEPGKVERAAKRRGRDEGHDVFRAGEHDGRVSSRIRALAEMLEPIDGARTTDNLWGERWAKLSQNCMGNPVTAVSGLGMADLSSSSRGRELMIRLASESAAVGLTLGYRVLSIGGHAAEKWAQAHKGDVYEELDAGLAAKSSGANWRPSMAQDVVKGRPTEIDEMNGFIVEKGRMAGVPTPASAAIVDALRMVETGDLEPVPANLERVLEKAGY